MKTISATLIGAGPLGINLYRSALQRRDIRITQVIDIEPTYKGRDIGEHAGGEATNILIQDKLDPANKTDIAILATVSDLPRIAPQLMMLIEAGLPVVSTCEELFFPWESNRDLAQKIDAAAKEKGVAVLGTGVNPGFLMDTLPAMLSGVCTQVERIEIRRYQDAQFRRVPFQKKIGAGLSLEEFEKRKTEGNLRHVGLTESMQFIAEQLSWEVERVEDKIEPVISHRNIQTDHLQIISGQAAGVRQIGRAWVNGEERIRLIFQASVGEQEVYDEIEIFGTPHIRSRIMGGVHGDIATCAIILNACKSILQAQPGLRTMADIPMVTSTGV